MSDQDQIKYWYPGGPDNLPFRQSRLTYPGFAERLRQAEKLVINPDPRRDDPNALQVLRRYYLIGTGWAIEHLTAPAEKLRRQFAERMLSFELAAERLLEGVTAIVFGLVGGLGSMAAVFGKSLIRVYDLTAAPIGSVKSSLSRRASSRFKKSRVFRPAFHDLRAQWLASLEDAPSGFGRWRLRVAFHCRLTLLAVDCFRCATWAKLTGLPRKSA